MKRGFLAVVFVVGFVVAGACSGIAAAESSPSSGATAGTIEHSTKLAAGVRIAGVAVSALDEAHATAAVASAFARPLPISVDGAQVTLDPRAVSTPYIASAVARAAAATPGTNVQLGVSVPGDAIRAFVA